MRHSQAFTLIELLVVISIIAILAAMLLPAIRVVKDLATQQTCANNLRLAGTFLLQYTADNDGRFPGGGHDGNGSVSWNSIVNTELLADQAVKMPRWGRPKNSELGCSDYRPTGLYDRGWAMNLNACGGTFDTTTNTSPFGQVCVPTTRNAAYTAWTRYYLGAAIDRFKAKPLKLLIAEVEQGGDNANTLSGIRYRHRGGNSTNVLFIDGHVQGLADPVSSATVQFSF